MFRREVLWAVGASVFAPSRAFAAPVPSLPLAIAVARRAEGSAPVVDAAFVSHALERANEIFGEHGLSFFAPEPARALGATHADLEDRAARDALASDLVDQRINVFIVRSLRDVDDPALHRMGVTWRKLSNLKKRYVIVAASARDTTLAHELGHFLGNDHSYVKNNLMSYDRDEEATHPHIFLDAKQGARAAQAARALFASGELSP